MACSWRTITHFGWSGLLGLFFVLAFASPLQAQNDAQSYSFRLYYSPFFSAAVAESPADPEGRYDEEPFDWSDKWGLEVVLLRHLGLSVSRVRFTRDLEESSPHLSESATGYTLDLTLYGSPVAHNSWNGFIGAGHGSIGNYRVWADHTRIDEAPLYHDLPLQRYFAGLEYTFERLGMRYEINQFLAKNSTAGQNIELNAIVHYFTFFIPLN